MYLKALITIDPAELSHIERCKPTKAFGKMAHFLTAGLSSPKQERETFTAVSVLQSINRTMHAIGVDNIVRLSKDSIDFYFDDDGIPQDLRACMDAFEREIDPTENEVFNTLSLVLEHHEPGMTYLIQVNIFRNHDVGIHPIEIHINGIANEFARTETDESQARAQMDAIFQKQEIHDAFLLKSKGQFEQFMGRIIMAIHTHMHVEAVQHQTMRKFIAPGNAASTLTDNRATPLAHEPVFHGYHGIDNIFWYAWIWSDLWSTHQIQGPQVGFVDATGADLGAELDAYDISTQKRENTEVVLGDSGSGYHVADGDSKRSSWFDSLFGEDGFFSGDGDGGSSCGGGCGGGCGGD